MATELIFTSNELFSHFILPFLLVFTLVFAVLEKSKLLGDNKNQINAIIGFVTGLIFIAFPYARDIVIKLIPFMAVVLVILFVFMLLYGFMAGKKEGDVLGSKLKNTIGFVIIVSVVIAVLVFTGTWNNIWNYMNSSGNANTIWVNLFFVLIVAAGIWAVFSNTKNEGSSGE